MQLQNGAPYILSFGSAGKYPLIMLSETEIELTDLRTRSDAKDERQRLPVKMLVSTSTHLRLAWNDKAEGEKVSMDIDLTSGSATVCLKDPTNGDTSRHQGSVSGICG